MLEVPGTGIPRVPLGFTQPIMVELCVPAETAAGNYSGTVRVVAGASGVLAVVPVRVEVWDMPAMPGALDSSDAFNTAFAFGAYRFGEWNTSFGRYYPNDAPESVWSQWFSVLAKHRIAADNMYLFKPRPIKEYELLAKSAKHMALFDVRVSGTGELEESMQQIQTMLTPTIEKLTELGLINRTYIYGFDEMSQTHNRSVYEMFGQIKKRWPEIRTMAALDWETMQSDVPVDIWIDEIADYGSSPDYRTPTPKERVRQRWLANPGKQFFWYWCIGPSDTRMLNTFVERPAIHGRMLFWLNALHAVDGMAYYSTDIWQNQCPDQRPCAPATRINGTALTTFNPATWNENNNSTNAGGANGDGSFLYPGPDGPLATNRLVNIADGIEDYQLFRRLGSTDSISNGDDLITQVIANLTAWDDDPLVLERARRQAARRIVARQAAARA